MGQFRVGYLLDRVIHQTSDCAVRRRERRRKAGVLAGRAWLRTPSDLNTNVFELSRGGDERQNEAFCRTVSNRWVILSRPCSKVERTLLRSESSMSDDLIGAANTLQLESRLFWPVVGLHPEHLEHTAGGHGEESASSRQRMRRSLSVHERAIIGITTIRLVGWAEHDVEALASRLVTDAGHVGLKPVAANDGMSAVHSVSLPILHKVRVIDGG